MDKWLEKAKSMRPGFLHIFDKDTFVGAARRGEA